MNLLASVPYVNDRMHWKSDYHCFHIRNKEINPKRKPSLPIIKERLPRWSVTYLLTITYFYLLATVLTQVCVNSWYRAVRNQSACRIPAWRCRGMRISKVEPSTLENIEQEVISHRHVTWSPNGTQQTVHSLKVESSRKLSLITPLLWAGILVPGRGD